MGEQLAKQQEFLLQIKDLKVAYKTEAAVVHAVNHINLTLRKQETTGLVGETGAGKTTAALALMQLLPERTGRIEGGQIIYAGEDLLKKSPQEVRTVRGAHISMIFQDPMTSLNPIMTVGNQIRESLEIHNYDNLCSVDLDKKVDELMELVGIPAKRKGAYPHQFSGGMKQRIVIAIALACSPELLLADEPTTALDVTIQAQILSLIDDLKAQIGTAVLMITHDLGVVAQTCDRTAIMYAGEIVEQGSVEDVFHCKMNHPYTSGLFGSIPSLEKESRRLSPIVGLMPDPTNLPTGCKFHPRCPHCMDICKFESPPAYQKDEHVIVCHLFSQEA